MRKFSRETFWDGVLATMVIISLFLSAKLWFPSTGNEGIEVKGTSIQEIPPSSYAAMPVIHRPERILVRRSDGKMALFMTSSTSYEALRLLVGRIINDLTQPVWVADPPTPTDGSFITLHMPFPLTFDEIADEWAWDGLSGHGSGFRVDQITVNLNEGGSTWLLGPAAGGYRLDGMASADRQELLAALNGLKEADLKPYRLLKAVEGVALRSPVWVPDVDGIQELSTVVTTPVRAEVEARFFPDLSVVRQIDEQGAVSLTDGQRLLRISDEGILDFNLAGGSRETGTPVSQMEVIRRWVEENGGWPRDVVQTRTTTQGGRSLYQFELRLVAAYPVESNGGALQIQLTGNQVLSFRRYPDVAGIRPGPNQLSIRTPEQALLVAAREQPLLSLTPIRDAYLSYQLEPGDGLRPWVVEPTWVFRMGEARVLVPARPDQTNRRVNLVR
ncbi:MAG TPA: hypothetical protein VK191_06730 [Symbiobacteriaceae bacterium]|nr:hypothetical protein [Symbiobacteriaceae bacterium]